MLTPNYVTDVQIGKNETHKKHEPLENIEVVEEEEGEGSPVQQTRPRRDTGADNKRDCLYKPLERTYSASFRLHPAITGKDVWAEEWHGMVVVHVPKTPTDNVEHTVPLVRSSG